MRRHIIRAIRTDRIKAAHVQLVMIILIFCIKKRKALALYASTSSDDDDFVLPVKEGLQIDIR